MAQLTGQERADYVQDMFDRIAGRYDLMNRLMTFGQDIAWRKTVVEKAQLPPYGRILDIATGTGDIAYEAVISDPTVQAVGGDFSIEMMRAGQRYPERTVIDWTGADALALPLPSDYFDATVSGFLMRNVVDVDGALKEQLRVLKPGGRIVILESSPPKDNALKPFINIHLNHVIPTIGKLVAGNVDAYNYLPDSTKAFKSPNALANAIRRAGFIGVGYTLHNFGTIAIHWGQKPPI